MCVCAYLDLTKNGISVVGQYDPSHGIQEHLQHCPWTETRANNVTLYIKKLVGGYLNVLEWKRARENDIPDSFCCLNVTKLGLVSGFSFHAILDH